MTKDQLTIEGDDIPGGPYRLVVNGEMQEGGFPSIDAARAAVTRQDRHVEVFHHNKRVYGKPLPERPARPSEIKSDKRSRRK